MNRKIRKSVLLIPVLYIAIIVFLIFFQFSGGSVFTEKFGQITLNGKLGIREDIENPPISSVVVEYSGLQFIFDDDHPLIIETAHNTDMPFAIAGYRQENNDLVVFFDQDVELVFRHDQNQLTIVNKIPETLNNPTSLRIPFMLRTGSRAESIENFSRLNVNSGAGRYILTLPPRSYVDMEKQLINIPEDGLEKSIRYTLRTADNETISALLSEDQLEEISLEQYQAEIRNFTDRAYLGWGSGRYNPSSGTWLLDDEEARFSEEALISLLSEAWLRNEYTRNFNEMRTAADIHPLELTYRSSVFLGNLRNMTNRLDAEERQENIQINNMVNQNNALIFLNPNLFQYIEQQANNDLRTNLLLFVENLLPGTLTSLEALGLCMNYYLNPPANDETRQILSRFESLVEEKILPSIEWTNEGFFFLTDDGIADAYYSVIAGRVFIEAGISKQNEGLINLGRSMVMSVIRLGNQFSLIPAKIEIVAGAVSTTEGILLPEKIYPLITDNPYYPRTVSLIDYFGSGSWGYGIFDSYEIASGQGELNFSFVHNPDRTHYMFFRGISNVDPLSGMELFGIIWRDAPDFEIYSKGRYYNANNNTLMIKFFDDETQQRIRIFY